MNQPTTHTRFMHTFAALLIVGFTTAHALAVQDAEPDQAVSGLAGDRPDRPDRPRVFDLPTDELIERLNARMAELDEARSRLAEASDALSDGASPREALGPVAGWLIERWPDADRPGWQGRPGAGPMPGRGPGPDAFGRDPERDDRQGRDRRGDRAGPPGFIGEPGFDVSDEETLAFIREHFTTLAERLEHAGNENPEFAARLLGRLKPRLADAIRLKDEDPEYAKLRVSELKVGFEIMQQARLLGSLTGEPGSKQDPEQVLAETELRRLLDQQFFIEQRLALHRIGRETDRLEAMREQIADRAARRDEIIDDHLDRVRERTKSGRRRDRDHDRDDERGRDSDRKTEDD